MTARVEWKCPECGAEPNKHGSGGVAKCEDHHSASSGCGGFVCDCDCEYDAEDSTHGVTFGDPCENARCFHCRWEGSFPVAPKKVAPWEKRALAAGWTPPPKRAAELGMTAAVAGGGK